MIIINTVGSTDIYSTVPLTICPPKRRNGVTDGKVKEILLFYVNEREWSGVEWSGVEWSGVEWSGVEWRNVRCHYNCNYTVWDKMKIEKSQEASLYGRYLIYNLIHTVNTTVFRKWVKSPFLFSCLCLFLIDVGWTMTVTLWTLTVTVTIPVMS